MQGSLAVRKADLLQVTWIQDGGASALIEETPFSFQVPRGHSVCPWLPGSDLLPLGSTHSVIKSVSTQQICGEFQFQYSLRYLTSLRQVTLLF